MINQNRHLSSALTCKSTHTSGNIKMPQNTSWNYSSRKCTSSNMRCGSYGFYLSPPPSYAHAKCNKTLFNAIFSLSSLLSISLSFSQNPDPHSLNACSLKHYPTFPLFSLSLSLSLKTPIPIA